MKFRTLLNLAHCERKKVRTSICEFCSIIWERFRGCCKQMVFKVGLSMINNSESWTMDMTALSNVTWRFFCNINTDQYTILPLKGWSQMSQRTKHVSHLQLLPTPTSFRPINPTKKFQLPLKSETLITQFWIIKIPQ